MRRSAGDSLYIGSLPRGCQQCMEGAKLVFFVTGLCHRRCFYCPLSRDRQYVDVMFADEVPVRDWLGVLLEGRAIDSKGAGITGGDPLLVVKRVVRFVKLLKRFFGSDYHIHLYTPGLYASRSAVKALAEAGVDELRFHVHKLEELGKLRFSLEAGMATGVEVPAIPGSLPFLKSLARRLESLSRECFLNVNELEFSETNYMELLQRGFQLKEGSMAAVEGSEETAIKLLEWAEEEGLSISIHYCPSSLKDGVQTKRRLQRRLANVKHPSEEVFKSPLLRRVEVLADASRLEARLLKRFLVKFGVVHPWQCRLQFENSRSKLILPSSVPPHAVKSALSLDNLEIRRTVVHPTYNRMVVEAEPIG